MARAGDSIASLNMETSMTRFPISIPELAFTAGTRAVGGVGIGLLLAGCLRAEQRKGIGLALLAIGVLTTVPVAREVFVRRRDAILDASS
jgi:hypothetical protein